MQKIVIGLMCFIVSQTILFAGQTPKGLVTDSRIKIVNYDEDNVVHINTTFGYATTIELQKGEYITEGSGIGKNAGWEIVSPNYSSLIIVKPKLENNTTNLNVTTNKGRTYTFLLTASSETSRPTFRVRFMYSDLKFNEMGISKGAYSLIKNFGNPDEVNSNYSFWGDKTIAPILAKDNGTFTLLRFKKGAPIPAILAVDLKTKRESLVNYRLQGAYVVVEGVYPQFSLRKGAHVTCLFNDKAIHDWQEMDK
ncbi:MAG: TrbG/VirB9 family P-type conjugative transfer protein [Silvanigrellaceae bacterium]|nr:TrbG/VirB9 family P-type conjugative transfer protein [Silvanigrellaceae bacterium]